MVKNNITGTLKLVVCLIILSASLTTGAETVNLQPTHDFIKKALSASSSFELLIDAETYAETSITRRTDPKKDNATQQREEILNLALQSFALFKRGLSLDPYKNENLPDIILAHKLFLGTSFADHFPTKMTQNQLLHQPQINQLWQLYKYQQHQHGLPMRLAQDSEMLKLELNAAQGKQKTLEVAPVPLQPEHLRRYASLMLNSGHRLIAREACERINILEIKDGLGNEIDLIDLTDDTARPAPKDWLGNGSGQVATLALLLFEPAPATGSTTSSLGIIYQVVIPRIERGFGQQALVIPEDVVDHLLQAADSASATALTPEFGTSKGYMLMLTRGNLPALSLLGRIDRASHSGCIYALDGGMSKIIDNPESSHAINLILKTAGIVAYYKSPQYANRKIVNKITLTSSTGSASDAEKDKFLTDAGDLKQNFTFQAMPPDSGAIEFAGLSWSGTASDVAGLSFSFMRARHGAEGEIPEAAPKMLEITRKVRDRLAAVAGSIPAGCHVNGITGDESINREPPEDRWLRAWSIRHGLPVGNELRKLLRLYKIIGAPLPETLSLRMPLLFRANFVNPRRPEGEHDMISGYWFDELELLVIADFDTDTGSPLGQFAAESVGLKGELAAENARIVLYDGFNFKNHGLRLAIPAENKAGDKLAAELDKHQIKPSEDGMMLENPESYRFFASISDRVCFILSEKDKPLQMRFAEEPEK